MPNDEGMTRLRRITARQAKSERPFVIRTFGLSSSFLIRLPRRSLGEGGCFVVVPRHSLVPTHSSRKKVHGGASSREPVGVNGVAGAPPSIVLSAYDFVILRSDHFNPLNSNSAFVFVASRFSINFSIASIGGSAAMVLRSICTRSHSSG
jgi:hypothetical protein